MHAHKQINNVDVHLKFSVNFVHLNASIDVLFFTEA